MKTYFATYGTLRLNGALKETPELGRARLVGKCIIPGVLYQAGGYPVLKRLPGRVTGDLLELSPHYDFRQLDIYEDYNPRRPDDCRYVRRRIRLIEPNLDAWVYFYRWPADASTRFQQADWVEVSSAGVKVRRFREDRRPFKDYPPEHWVQTGR